MKYKTIEVAGKNHEVPVMAYYCSRCGNELKEDELPDPPPPVEGSRGTIRFEIFPVCNRHNLPYAMSSRPEGHPDR